MEVRAQRGLPNWLYGLTVVLALACPALWAQPPVQLDAQHEEIALSPSLTYRHDTGKIDSPKDAFARVKAGEFASLPGGKSEFGFQPGAFWFHASLLNRDRDEPRWLLVQEYALSDLVDVYLRYPDGRIRHQVGGDHRPFDVRSIRYRQPNFMLDLPYGQPVELLVRVESQSSMQVPLILFTPKAFTEMMRDAQFATGAYYGILLGLFFYNLMLWLSLRDASYFWYLFHLSAFGMVLFTLNGFGFEYLWPKSAWLADKAVPLSICLALIGMQQFARTFLDLPERWKLGNWISLAIIAFFVVLGLASLELPYRVSTPIASRAVLVGVLWIAIASVVAVRRGYKPARLFLIAWGLFLLGTTLVTMVAFGILPKTFLTEYGVQIGSALEMLLLSLALGSRYSGLRAENERIVGEAKIKLERQVAERTQELRGALVQLEEAHARLSDSSRRDSLTGLYTRAYFHETFEQMLFDCQQRRHPLSLLMIDLDHFKAINDRYGHLVGDDCLRNAAQRIGKILRAHDALLARFGGEEFVVGLPDHGLHAAVEVAEALRRSLVEELVESHGHGIRISASVGVHTIAPGSIDNMNAALEIADKALYSAKANGRDCVKTSISAA